MTQKKRRGGRAPVGRGPIGTSKPQRKKSLGNVKVSPAVHGWMQSHGLLADEIAELVYRHIDGLKAAGKPNTYGATTFQTLPGIQIATPFAVIKITKGHLVIFANELGRNDLEPL